MSRFDAGSLDDQQQSLNYLIPNGPLFCAKNISESNLYKLIRGLAWEIWRVEKKVNGFVDNYDIWNTEDLIVEWENAVGIPDSCITQNYPLDQRRKHVIAKFKALGCATEQDFIDLAKFLGYDITIKQLGSFAYPPYDVPFIPVQLPGGRFVWVIEGKDVAAYVPPYGVPFTPRTGSTILQCFFNALKPANTILYFINT